MQSLFPTSVIYKWDSSCDSRYIGKTKRNVEVRQNVHNNPTKSSEPSKHLWSNINHCFTWAVITNAPDQDNATKRNSKTRWDEHDNLTKSSEPSKHLWSNINHCFRWTVISNGLKNAKTRKNLEASYTAVWKPNTSEQKDFERLVLSRNGVT